MSWIWMLLKMGMMTKEKRPPFDKIGYKTIQTHKCSGHCCKVFYLPYSFDEMNHFKRLSSLGKTKEEKVKDLFKIANLIIPVRAESCKTYAIENSLIYSSSRKSSHMYNVMYYYTCKNYDAIKHKCLDYENRPSMCSKYPYMRQCYYRDCTLKYIHVPTIETIRRKILSVKFSLKLKFKKKQKFEDYTKLKGESN